MRCNGLAAIHGAALLLALAMPAFAQDEGRGIGYAIAGPVFHLPAGVSVELSDKDTVSAGAELSWADVEDAFGKNKYLTASIPIEYVRDTRDDKLNPTDGYRFLINAKPSYEAQRGTFFSSFEGAITGYKALGAEDRFVLAGKLAGGTIIGGDQLSDIPATRRFYLGGGGTVRGYGYQEISPRNGANQLLGGRSYMAASAEVRIGITETIGLVPFIDAGAPWKSTDRSACRRPSAPAAPHETVSVDVTPDGTNLRSSDGKPTVGSLRLVLITAPSAPSSIRTS